MLIDYPLEQYLNFSSAKAISSVYIAINSETTGWKQMTVSFVEPDVKIAETCISQECIEFCHTKGLISVRDDCLRKAREVFSNIEKLYAELDNYQDDESEDSEHVVIRLEVTSNQQTMLDQYDRMVSWMAENIAPKDSGYFTLTVERL
jgi:hypothetical protein